jgi:S-adenosylmethionine hydrolase
MLTDFGTSDSYVAEMKGVVLSRVPDAVLVDITHDIAPGDIRSAQFVLQRAWARFPAGSVHLAVVDPGVGSARRALAARHAGHGFVGPDNGLLTPVLADATIVSLPIPDGAAPTFHGRDVFAPAAATLASGAPLDTLGERIADPVRLSAPRPEPGDGMLTGTVVYVDRFGTLVTNLAADRLPPAARIEIAGRDAGPLRRTFSDVHPGALVPLIGSGGTVEVAVRDGSAARVLGAGTGAVARALFQ